MKSLQINQLTPLPKSLSCSELSCLEAEDYTLAPFDDRTLNFLNALSKAILSDKTINRRPEIAALGFWLRHSQLKKMQLTQEHFLKDPNLKLAPLGKVFHICPANVDTMFIYSMVVSLLMGNRNILRISKRVDAFHVLNLFDKLNKLMLEQEFGLFKSYINIIRYDHNDEINNFLSLSCNARLIWGGDKTIETFQSFKKSARTKDIVFSDRISLMILDSESVLSCRGKAFDKLMQDFFNDGYTFDQKGCSSPQTIYFLGSTFNCEQARKRITRGIEEVLVHKYENDLFSISSVKLNKMVDDALRGTISGHSGNNVFKLLELEESSNAGSLQGCGGGYFYYRNGDNILDMKEVMNSKIQTISYFGLSEDSKKQLFSLAYGEGIDRIVKVGNALKFHYLWDGYNLFQELSRKVYLER